jgi:hypothetical protein
VTSLLKTRQGRLWAGLTLVVAACLALLVPGCVFQTSNDARRAIAARSSETVVLTPTAAPTGDGNQPAVARRPDDGPGAGSTLRRKLERAYLPLIRAWRAKRLYLPLAVNAQPSPTPTPRPTKKPKPKPTRPPPPTPTPTPPWPEPLEEPGNSKLGLHVEWNNSPDIMEFIRRTKPAVVKAVGDFGFLEEIKAVSPTTITVARLVQGAQTMEGDPAQAARAFVAQNLEQYRLNPAVDYWEGWNEPAVRGDQMRWYAAFEAERTRAMAEHGFRVAVGAFSTGTPEWEDFGLFLPAIQAARQHGGILTVHEYDAPTMQRAVGAGLPGHPNYPDRGALALRYRWWYQDFLLPRGLVIPLVISEAGIDGGLPNRPGPGDARGWQNFADYWKDQGLGGAVDAYVRQLAWYDAQVRQDPYVIGFTVFTAGAISEQWKSFDVTPILRDIATYVVSQK